MTAFLIVLVIAGTVAGNLLLKLGAMRSNMAEVWLVSFLNIYVLVGATSFGLALLGYAYLLRYIPLNLAQAVFSVQFVAVILASWLILDEPISLGRWLGIGLIALGILVVAWTANG